MHLYEGDASQAVAVLEDALTLLRQLNDPSWDADILGQLGWLPWPTRNAPMGKRPA